METIAETAWHHEGDFPFMSDLVDRLCEESSADYVKLHVTLDFDEYMAADHDSYEQLKKWLFSENQWADIIQRVRASGKKLMLLTNDTSAIRFSSQFAPELIELHSACLNVPQLGEAVQETLERKQSVVIGIGGSTIEEVETAISSFGNRPVVLMFGFQNFPTKYEHVNLRKMRWIQKRFAECKYGYADHTAWNEPNNELVTLLAAANDMDFVEKHVTTVYGVERCDSSAAISIEMFNQLSDKLKLLEAVSGDGKLDLSPAERQYSVFGPMKMAAILTRPVRTGETLSVAQIRFTRTKTVSDMGQVEVLTAIGRAFNRDLEAGDVLMRHFFEERPS